MREYWRIASVFDAVIRKICRKDGREPYENKFLHITPIKMLSADVCL